MADTLTDAEVLEALESYNRGDALMKIDLDAREIEADRAMEGSPILLPNFTQPQLFLFGGRRLNCEIQT